MVDMMKNLYTVVRHGYDFEPQIIAICDNIKSANDIVKGEGEQLPWNYVTIINGLPELNKKIDWEKSSMSIKQITPRESER
jgi:F420-0:gamma-glutamyl ligase